MYPGVAGVDPVSKAQALDRFTRDFPDLASAARNSPNNPFPASLEVRLSSARVDPAAVERLARLVARMPGVSDVRYDRRWLERLSAVAGAIRWTGYALSAVLIFAAALTISNVVRLALVARRDEIEIMELVGAPWSFIRGPFICEGILQGALGALVALVVLRAAFVFSRSSLDTVAQLAGADAAAFLPLSWAATPACRRCARWLRRQPVRGAPTRVARSAARRACSSTPHSKGGVRARSAGKRNELVAVDSVSCPH